MNDKTLSERRIVNRADSNDERGCLIQYDRKTNGSVNEYVRTDHENNSSNEPTTTITEDVFRDELKNDCDSGYKVHVTFDVYDSPYYSPLLTWVETALISKTKSGSYCADVGQRGKHTWNWGALNYKAN
jgi:hypothetical protein